MSEGGETRNDLMDRYFCPNGHPFAAPRTILCNECRAGVVVVPMAALIKNEEELAEARQRADDLADLLEMAGRSPQGEDHEVKVRPCPVCGSHHECPHRPDPALSRHPSPQDHEAEVEAELVRWEALADQMTRERDEAIAALDALRRSPQGEDHSAALREKNKLIADLARSRPYDFPGPPDLPPVPEPQGEDHERPKVPRVKGRREGSHGVEFEFDEPQGEQWQGRND